MRSEDLSTRHSDSSAYVEPSASGGSSPPRRRVSPGRVPATCTRYVRHISYSVVREHEPATRDKLDCPESVAVLARRVITDDDREHFYAFFVNSQNRLLSAHHVSTGSLSASIVHPREVLGPAIREGAAHVILAHNHPSGDPTPSREDIALTRQLADGARLLGLRVHDHVILGSGTESFVSLAQRGLLR
jgi:DNA repair protein RadC